MNQLLQIIGIETIHEGESVKVNSADITSFEAPYEQVKKMRASIYVLGPLVARFGEARVSLPGGCAWGPRPVNLHLEGLKALGAEIELEEGYIIAKARKLKSAKIVFEVPSVGATGNIMMAATLARGTSVIENAAIEPEITALAQFLVSMGAKIDGIGTTRLEIEGVETLHPTDASMIPDRIEAGTFLVAAMMNAGSKVRISACEPNHFSAILVKLESAGAKLNVGESWIEITAPDSVRSVDVTTSVFPGFPTDMQAQWIALMSIAKGRSVITDSIYLDRFMHVPELNRLGAKIEMKKNVATVTGVDHLSGAKVMSTDLRASASLILGGLAAKGVTEVLRVYHIDRGYDHIEKKLKSLGANIRRESGDKF